MYLVRRVFKVKPGTARKAADLIHRVGKAYEKAGQRSPTRVYVSGGGLPGPANMVYMDWTEEAIRPPNRSGNKIPDEIGPLMSELSQFQEDTYIEFYELYQPQ